MSFSHNRIGRFLCMLLALFAFVASAQNWMRYSPQEADNLKKFRALLENDTALKGAYERYQTAVKKQKTLLESDKELQDLRRQLKEENDALGKLREADRGGNEVSHQNKLIRTLERKIKERLDGNAELKALEAEIAAARKALREKLEANEIELYDFRLTLDDLRSDGDVEIDVCEVPADYELRGENPFKDTFADLSKALFQKNFAREATAEITKALVSQYPKSSPEIIGKCIGFFYNPGTFIPPEGKLPEKALDDVFEECVRLLTMMRTIKQDDKAGWEEHQRARLAVYHRMEGGSIFRFIWAYQWSGQEHPEVWMNDFAQWIADHPEQSGLMKYVHELLDYTYEADNKYDKTQMMMLEEQLELMEDQLKDKWMLHVVHSINSWRRAWNARGGGYADSVSEQGWKIWGREKKKAIQEAQAAIKLHPEWPAGYLGLLEDFGGNHIAEFNQLMRYRPDFTEAYRKMIWGLLPRWGGSHAHIVALARACMETRRYDTALPSIGFNLLGLVAWDTAPWAQWSRVYRQTWLEPLAIELFDARIAQTGWLRRDTRLDKALFFIAIGKYSDAAVLVKSIEADYGGKEVVFPSWNGRMIGNWYVKVPAWEDALTHMRLMTGEYAAQLKEIEQLSKNPKTCAKAIDLLAEFIKAHPQLNGKQKEYLVDQRARWQMPDVTGQTYAYNNGWGVAFNPAFDRGHTKVIREMMEFGIDYKIYEHFPGEMALYVARRGSDPEMLDLLKDMGDPLDRPEKDPKFQGDRPIHLAVMTSNIPMMKKLLSLGVSPNATNDHGHTPIHFCAQHGSVEGIRILLEAGASPDAQDADGDTPLMFIPQTQVSPECLRLLAKASKNVNIGNHSGMTALHFAAQCGDSPEYIRILLEAGADPQARTPSGKAPYDLAMARHREDLAALLPKPDPKGGTVYQTKAPMPEGKGRKVTANGSNDLLAIVTAFICMPEVYGVLACIVVAGVVWLVIRKIRN